MKILRAKISAMKIILIECYYEEEITRKNKITQSSMPSLSYRAFY